MATKEAIREWITCKESCEYFIDNYVQIYDATRGEWVPFKLWAAQISVLNDFCEHRLVIVLKARQLGMTWLALAYILWLLLFHPSKIALLFSRRDEEAMQLLERMQGIYTRLPEYMHAKAIIIDNAHIWQLSNGSAVYCFPTTAGDSYTASIALVDEADLVPDLNRLMSAVKPTIDGGGRMILLSRADKENPASVFKNMYRGARDGKSPWKSIFLPWFARPERDASWYETQKEDVLSRTHNLDDLLQQYPANDEEALQAPTMDKRVPIDWLRKCFSPMDAIEDDELGIPGLVIYRKPEWFNSYVMGADPAEGNPTSDPSSLHVLDDVTGEEVAMYSDRVQPVNFAELIALVSSYFNKAPVLVERNNHGHAVIGHLTENTSVIVKEGWDGNPGWHTTARGKALMWTNVVNAFRDNKVTIHSQSTFTEINSIDGRKLKAPDGMHDDEAVSFALAAIGAIGFEEEINAVYSYDRRTAYSVRTR